MIATWETCWTTTVPPAEPRALEFPSIRKISPRGFRILTTDEVVLPTAVVKITPKSPKEDNFAPLWSFRFHREALLHGFKTRTKCSSLSRPAAGKSRRLHWKPVHSTSPILLRPICSSLEHHIVGLKTNGPRSVSACQPKDNGIHTWREFRCGN